MSNTTDIADIVAWFRLDTLHNMRSDLLHEYDYSEEINERIRPLLDAIENRIVELYDME